ncbi:hypothetical protein GCM10009347_20620 [Shewanella algicola]|uniref:DUF3466 family protein n=1 Tax=Shewanella algicola TaxID=640633 RepID=A0A9X2CBI6_9GAMM|nr:DUF3466 family protein [Shewanella algicola]MCL1107665.1 DUF3466 family protein [Shewanella algicola]GGP53647.1 hypothetical protein GCM10009347_20620 [Shewanella algicola]
MKLKFDKALSLVAIGVLSVIGSAQAASVYEIVNIEDYDLNGTLDGTRNGYAMAINDEDELVGISKGKKKLTTDDVDDSVIDVEDGISEAETITYSVYSEIEANNFTFIASDNASVGSWVPEFFSMANTFDPSNEDYDDDDELIVNDVDTYFYGINNNGVKVGAYTGEELTLDYEGTSTTQEYFYYRKFELRGIAVKNDIEYPLMPSFTTYERDQTSDVDAATVEVGGWSLASRVNSDNLVVGYGSTELSSASEDRIDNCIEEAEDTDVDNPIPTDICVQILQYPDAGNGTRYIQYQTRGFVWDLDNLDEDGLPESTELELGLTPDEDSTLIFTSQGLGINSNGDVAGRSHVYRNGDEDDLYFDAAYWTRDENGDYEYNWVEMEDEVYYSIAYDINDSGILVGSYTKYIDGYLRSKFFTFDTNNPEEGITTPNDFQTSLSDLSSKGKDINNQGQVVGYIESTYDKDTPRPKVGFLYDMNTEEFVDLNEQLTCESKGFLRNTDGDWERNTVSVQDGTGEILTYESDISVVEANSINEDGTIVGTAFIRKPEYQYDTSGDLIVGENGLALFELDGNGDPVTSYLPRMVVLKPTGGEACSSTDAEDDGAYERQGAASFGWLFALPFLWLRRRVKK